MLRSYLKSAVRRLVQHKAYALINILGLAVGMACCVLMLLYAQDELSYDRFHEKADRIYRVNGTSENPEGDFYRTTLPPPVAPALQATYPEVETATRVVQQPRSLVTQGTGTYYEDRLFLADAAFFDVFTVSWMHGDSTGALREPGTVILTETTARKYFGEADPLGQVLTVEHRVDLTVTGIVRDLPSNSHLHFDFLVALETAGLAREGWLESWGSSSAATYVLLRPEATLEVLEAKLPRFVDRYLAEELDEHEVYTLTLQALPDIHLYPHRVPEEIWAAGTLKYVYIFSILGLALLLIACVNYVNLSTAGTMDRAREVGIRKVLGSPRAHLVGQFLGESVLTTGTALAVAFALIALCLPTFNALAGKTFALAHLFQPASLPGLLGLWALVGLASGLYPAFFLSAARPAIVVKGHLAGGAPGRALLRNGLVVFQFGTAVILIVATLVARDQLDFMRQKDLGYDREHVVVVPIRDQAVWQQAESVRDELLRLPGVRAVAFSSGIPNQVGWNSTAQWEGAAEDEALEVNHIMVDFDFLDVFGLERIAGRGFSRNFPGDIEGAYVLNEAAVRALGWEDPIGKKVTLWDREAPVIGVIKDFHFASLHEPIGPLVLHFGPQWYRMASVKIVPGNVSGTLAALETTLHRFVPDRPFEYTFLDASFDQIYRTEERFSRITALFTTLAVFLACLGLLGLTAFVIEQRTREIGIRKVFGASVPGIVWLLTRRFVGPVFLALCLAVPVAYLATNQWLEDFAYRIEISWPIFLMAGSLALAIAWLTIGYQSIRAALANPAQTLRHH